MLKQNPNDGGQKDLFQSRLDQILDMKHELVKLAGVVDWAGLEDDLSAYYCADTGRPGGSIRLMSGLIFLKDAKGLSDEEVCSVWRENPYFQYFCGEAFFQHRLPVEPPSLSIFRKRIGEEGSERLLQETIRMGLKTGTLTPRDLQHVNVDTTVQEKAVRFPTDTQLCHKAREELVKKAKKLGVKLRQSYARKGKHGVFMANKYMAARQMRRGRRMIATVRNYLAGSCGTSNAPSSARRPWKPSSKMTWPRPTRFTPRPPIPKRLTKSIPGTHPRWNASPRARPTRSMSSAVKPALPPPMPATSSSAQWHTMDDPMTATPWLWCSPRSSASPVQSRTQPTSISAIADMA